MAEPTETEKAAQVRTCYCYEQAVQILGKRWTGLLLSALLHGPLRFSELEMCIEGLSARILSHRLRELESEGIVQQIIVPTHCTGFRAIHQLATLLPEAFIQSSVGTRFEL